MNIKRDIEKLLDKKGSDDCLSIINRSKLSYGLCLNRCTYLWHRYLSIVWNNIKIKSRQLNNDENIQNNEIMMDNRIIDQFLIGVWFFHLSYRITYEEFYSIIIINQYSIRLFSITLIIANEINKHFFSKSNFPMHLCKLHFIRW
jgi:hypothetical protein